MYKSVLLTIDLGQEASWKKALPQAVELVKASGGVLHVFSAVPDMGTPLVEGFFPDDFEHKAIEAASAAMDKLVQAQVPSDMKVHQHLAFGRIHEKILDTISSTGCDLVVMASHEPSRVREFLVGSNADRVVRRAPVSVLVVRG